MWGGHTVCFSFCLSVFQKYMHTDSSVQDGNVDAGQGENDEKKEQGRKVKCLCFVFYTPDSPLSLFTSIKKTFEF